MSAGTPAHKCHRMHSQAAMELDDGQKAAMLAARRRLLADMGTLC